MRSMRFDSHDGEIAAVVHVQVDIEIIRPDTYRQPLNIERRFETPAEGRAKDIDEDAEPEVHGGRNSLR